MVNHTKFKRYLISGKTTRQLADRHDVCIGTIRSRIASGWTDEEMLNGYRKYNAPLYEGLTVKQLAEKQGVRYDTVRRRIYKHWPINEIINPSLRPRGYIFKMNNETKTLKDISKKYDISIKVLRARLKEFWRIEYAIRASKNHRRVKKCSISG